jgi:Zn-dependent peptidase ImmA (M78 family)
MEQVLAQMTETELAIYNKYANKFPFPLVDFANEIGIDLFLSSNERDTLSGYITYDADTDKYSIVLNENDSQNRKRFTLAHELGHYFYDKDYLKSNKKIEDGVYHKKWLARDKLTTDKIMRAMDVKANQFAADILMPKDKFIEYWNNGYPPENIANYFGVSIQAVMVRASVLVGAIV